jgi:hypothetical protein
MDKKDMVRILLPDYIDGTASLPPSYQKLGIFQLFQQVLPDISQIELRQHEMIFKSPQSRENVFGLIERLGGEEPGKLIRSFIRVWSGYISDSKEFNNYVFSKNLVKAFGQSLLDVKCGSLPEDFNGYLDLKGANCGEGYYNADLVGAFVTIHFDKLTVLAFGQFDGMVSPVYFQYDLEKGKTLDEVIFDLKEAPDFLKIILTAVLYVTHSPDDLIEQINEFPRSESKASTLKKHYTQRKYVIVGKFFTLPKQYTDKWITNKGYFAFRRVGKGRTELKYTWISPSKPYQKGQGGNNGS